MNFINVMIVPENDDKVGHKMDIIAEHTEHPTETATQVGELIVYEYPLNDATRICLRLEKLFKYTFNNLYTRDPSCSRIALNSLLEILNVIDRPDLKSKLTQTLTQYSTALNDHIQTPHVNQNVLQSILIKVQHAMHLLRQMHGRLGETLRKNQFLNTIRVHLSHPGGACDYSTPGFALWLTQDASERSKQLLDWFAEFNELKEIVELILSLTRQSAEWTPCQAAKGFYQQKLDIHASHQMLRLQIPISYQLIPEISVGKHRFSVRLLNPNFTSNGHAVQYKQDLAFSFVVCKI